MSEIRNVEFNLTPKELAAATKKSLLNKPTAVKSQLFAENLEDRIAFIKLLIKHSPLNYKELEEIASAINAKKKALKKLEIQFEKKREEIYIINTLHK